MVPPPPPVSSMPLKWSSSTTTNSGSSSLCTVLHYLFCFVLGAILIVIMFVLLQDVYRKKKTTETRSDATEDNVGNNTISIKEREETSKADNYMLTESSKAKSLYVKHYLNYVRVLRSFNEKLARRHLHNFKFNIRLFRIKNAEKGKTWRTSSEIFNQTTIACLGILQLLWDTR